MKKSGKSALIGLIVSLLFVVGGVIATGQPEMFWNLPSFFIIVGGTVGSFIIAYPPGSLKNFGLVWKKTFEKNQTDIRKDILLFVKIAELARKEGILSLENYADEYVEDEFIKKGLMMIIDGTDEESLRHILDGSTYFMKQRHNKGANMFGMLAATAPALGLLGTYVGLIPMLNSLDDPTVLGPMMALELVSSFYGAFIAYVIFSPMSKRLKNMSQEESYRREILIEGLVSIYHKKNPKTIKAELIAFANIDVDAVAEIEEKAVSFRAKEVTS